MVGLADPPTFSDVPADHRFATAVEWLVAQGVADGYDDGTFGGTTVLSRQALAALLYRLAGAPDVAASAAPSSSARRASRAFAAGPCRPLVAPGRPA